MRGFRASGAALVAVCALTALAAAAGKGKEPDKGRFDPQNRTALSRPMSLIVEGNARFAEKDYAGALAAYGKAVQLAPGDPLGHYMVAEANLAQGKLAEAEAALKAAEKAGDKRPDVLGKVMFLEADVKEREADATTDAKERAQRWAEARAGWARYGEWAAAHGDAGAVPQTPAARVKAIDDYAKLEAAYVEVRQRIAAEKADAGPAAPAKGDGGK